MYRGKIARIDCSKGGITDNPNMDSISMNMMLSDTRNLNLHNGGREKRGGTDLINSGNVIGSGAEIRGIFQARYENGSTYLITADADGKIWKGHSSETEITPASGVMSTANKFWFVMGDDLMFICDGAEMPCTSANAAQFIQITDNNADWTGSSFPAFMVAHGRLASRRMWAFGVSSATTATAIKTLYYSQTGDLDDFLNAGSGTIIIETEDDTGIVGAVELGDRLIAFSKTKSYLIHDDDTSTANWGYSAAQWTGGVAHQRLVVRTPNDVVCMDESGNIYSIRAAQEYGDYKVGSISRPSWMHKWIKDNVDLTKVADFHAQYDKQLRAIKFFVQLTSGSRVDTCLVYFIDRGPEAGWMIHDAASADSGYNAAASCQFLDGNNVPWIYTGSDDGFIWKLETPNLHDNSNAISTNMETPHTGLDNPEENKQFKALTLITQQKGAASLLIETEIDGQGGPSGVLTLTSSGDVLDTGVLDTFQLGAFEEAPQRNTFPINRNGKRIKFKISDSSIISDFMLSNMLIKYRPTGIRLD